MILPTLVAKKYLNSIPLASGFPESVLAAAGHGTPEELDVDYHVFLGTRAANQQVSGCWRLERIGIILHRPGNQSAFAGVANTSPASPTYRNIAGFRELQQALEFGLPSDCQSGARKRDPWTLAGRPHRCVRCLAPRIFLRSFPGGERLANDDVREAGLIFPYT